MKQGTALKAQGIVLIILLLALTIRYTLYPPPSYAQDSTPSGSLTQKLNELKNEIASKAAELKTQITKKVQNKAIIGSILDIRSGEISVQSFGVNKTVKYDEFTEIIGAKNKKITIKTLEASDNIAALGDVDDKNNLVAKRIVYLENFASNSAKLVYGQIQKTTGSVIIIKEKSGETISLATNPQTAFFLGTEEASLTDAKVEKYLITRATQLKDGSLKARFIYFVPSMGFLKPLKDSSPSAKPK